MSKKASIDSKTTTSSNFLLYVYVNIIILIVAIIYLLVSKFEKTITVSKKINYGMPKTNRNFISDESGSVYSISNSIIAWYFSGVEDFAKVEVNKTYKISGYGYRIGLLNMYPNITKIKLV